MKKSVLNFLEAAIPYTITPAKYITYAAVGFVAWQITGGITYSFLSNYYIGYAGSAISSGFEFARSIINSASIILGNLPLISNIPVISSISRVPSIILNPIINFISAIPKVIFSIPSPIAATFIPAGLLITKQASGISIKKTIFGKKGLSGYIAKNLEPYKKFELPIPYTGLKIKIGHAIKKIDQYSKSDNLEDFITKRIKKYKTKSITPVILSGAIATTAFAGLSLISTPIWVGASFSLGLYSLAKHSTKSLTPAILLGTIATTAFTGLSLIGAPIWLAAASSIGLYSLARSNIKEFSKELDNKGIAEVTGEAGSLISKGVSLGSFIAAPLTFYKNNALGHIFNALQLNLPLSLLSRPYLTGIFPILSLAIPALSQDKERGLFHRVFNSQFKTFSILASSSLTLALFVPVMPIIAPVLATTMHLGLVTGAFSALSLGAMSVYDQASLVKAWQDSKKFLTDDPLPFFDRPLGHVFLETWNMIGGLFAGSYIGFKLPFIQAKQMSSFIGGIIGAYVNKKIVDSYFPKMPEPVTPTELPQREVQQERQPEQSQPSQRLRAGVTPYHQGRSI